MTMVQKPIASILINNYNYGRFVGEAIESALNQTSSGVEVIVVDDGSTDNSREVIASFGDAIKAVLQENGGQASAINSGFAASRGDWIYLLDSDDLFKANKVRRVSELAAAYPTAGMIAHDLEYCTADGESLNFAAPYIRKSALIDDRQLARRGKLSVSLPATSGLCIRRDVLQSIFPLPKAIRVGIDAYIKCVLQSLFPVFVVPEFPAKQRIHGSNVGTILAETGGPEARVRLATQNATIAFHMKKEHPHLTKLAWKQYGRILYELRSCKSEESRMIENNIRARYSVAEKSPSCLFYMGAAFTKAYVEDLRKDKRPARK
jgi:glycosyltransferase involved in cell wall biosynthesis